MHESCLCRFSIQERSQKLRVLLDFLKSRLTDLISVAYTGH